MTREEMVKAAKAEAMEKHGGWKPELVAAIESGLVVGDKIGLGGKLVAEILDGDVVRMVNDGKETATLSLDEMTSEQKDRMLVLKGIQAGRTGWSIGTV